GTLPITSLDGSGNLLFANTSAGSTPNLNLSLLASNPGPLVPPEPSTCTSPPMPIRALLPQQICPPPPLPRPLRPSESFTHSSPLLDPSPLS
ncbi:hypothetical protein M9458_020884, partial [Cirrhinus mrigala]